MANVDFLDAHERHLDDADFLFDARRWANADHLYGLSAECGLKRLMEAFGMPLDTTGSPQKKDREHIDALEPRYRSYQAAAQHGAKYVYGGGAAFSGWSISQRYAPQSGFNQATVAPRAKAARDIGSMLKQARVEGLL